jgi:group II intron reverse transcriptase/maturase
MERRDQQRLNLIQSTRGTHRGATHGHRQDPVLENRWIRISLRAQNKNNVFENLLTHINRESLKEAFKAIDGSKAIGVDGIGKRVYGEDLEKNLEDLTKRIQNGSYLPRPKREVLIPKPNGKTRPIAIACFEDKLVDWVVGKILTQIHEPHFIQNSFGYRPGKSCGHAIEACYYSLFKDLRPNVVEIDFASFFNTIPHKELMRILGKRIKDRRFKGLIGRFLVGGLINKEGECLPSEIGTPQGSIMSPILANIYLDVVIDQWFKKEWKLNGVMVRYADDGVFFFKKEDDAKRFMTELKSRVESFKLKLNEEKTRVIVVNKKNHGQFNFLGFTFYWGKQGSRTILKVKTQKEKLIKGIQEFYQWIKKIRNRMKLNEIWSLAKSKIRGHVNYYGYWMNALKIHHFYWEAERALYKWLNRRSQKRSYTWEGLKERIKNFPLMKPLEEIKFKQLGWNPYAATK